MTHQAAAQCRIEHHCAAVVRAMVGRGDVEFQNGAVVVDGRAVDLSAPYLAGGGLSAGIESNRGAADCIAMRLMFSDAARYRRARPQAPVAALVFDILEQLRVESMRPPQWRGLARNIDAAHGKWRDAALATTWVASEIGRVIFSLIQVVRARFNPAPDAHAAPPPPWEAQTEHVIEPTWLRLSPMVGHELSKMTARRANQAAFSAPAARLAVTIADLIAQLTHDFAEFAATTPPRQAAAIRRQLWRALETSPAAESANQKAGAPAASAPTPVAAAQIYRIHSRAFDAEINAAALYRPSQRHALCQRLDKLVAAQALSVPRLAHRLGRAFATAQRDGWSFGEQHGYLDARRLSQLVSRPGDARIFKRAASRGRCDAALTFLVDNSGSMKRQNIAALATALDIYCRAAEMAGVATELLGFSTASWHGGRALQAWQRADQSTGQSIDQLTGQPIAQPATPGRLGERLHIVYKSARTPWRRARPAIAALLNPLHFREGLDGEALAWASARLNRSDRARKCLVLLSDGVPMESATDQYNDAGYLARHLKNTARRIEMRTDIELKAIGLGCDLNEYFPDSIRLDLDLPLNNHASSTLEKLFKLPR